MSTEREQFADGPLIGQEFDVEVGAIAHGGHCVARHEGVVVFVRHTLPGEFVRVRVTRGKAGDRFLFADAISILRPSPHRVEPPCRYAGPGGCGGCDFQHVELAEQRRLKAAVVAEQLHRLGGIDPGRLGGVVVEPVPGDRDGLRWRTRLTLAVDAQDRPGLRRFHSHDVLQIRDCLIATEAVANSGALWRRYPKTRFVEVVAGDDGQPVVLTVPPRRQSTPVVHRSVTVGDWSADFALDPRSFWQVHPGAAAALTGAVLEALAPEPGERCLDLYAGVGLFGRALADAVGLDGAVLLIEADERAARAARDWADPLPQAEVRAERVDRGLKPLLAGRDRVDLVVLDPPRSGAGREVMAGLAQLGPRGIAYVACDPAALARDLATARETGYRLASLRAFDQFPMTHHVECVAILVPETVPTDAAAMVPTDARLEPGAEPHAGRRVDGNTQPSADPGLESGTDLGGEPGGVAGAGGRPDAQGALR